MQDKRFTLKQRSLTHSDQAQNPSGFSVLPGTQRLPGRTENPAGLETFLVRADCKGKIRATKKKTNKH